MTDIVERLKLITACVTDCEGRCLECPDIVARQAAAEIERLRAEVASLRITLGGKTFSADIPSPVGCPMPGACAQVAEIRRLRRTIDTIHPQMQQRIYQLQAELDEAIERGNDWCDQTQRMRSQRNRLQAALKALLEVDDHWLRGNKDNKWSAMMAAARVKADAALKETGHE